MGSRLSIALFCEDAGHEAFARALVYRLAEEAGVSRPYLRPVSTRGGHGKAITELRLWQHSLGEPGGQGASDLLLVLIDGNGAGASTQRRLVAEALEPGRFPHAIVGCPDPHVEVWCAADLAALARVTGAQPPPRPTKAGRSVFKRWLSEALAAAGELVLNDPMDIAAELVPEMDLYAAAKTDPSLGHLVRELRAFFSQRVG